jgi:hypothetical protein
MRSIRVEKEKCLISICYVLFPYRCVGYFTLLVSLICISALLWLHPISDLVNYVREYITTQTIDQEYEDDDDQDYNDEDADDEIQTLHYRVSLIESQMQDHSLLE